MRLVDYKRSQWDDRAHFFPVSSQAMRRILVEHARRHNVKQGGLFGTSHRRTQRRWAWTRMSISWNSTVP